MNLHKRIIKIFLLIILVLGINIFISKTFFINSNSTINKCYSKNLESKKNIRIAVISDIHFFAPELEGSGKAFKKRMSTYGKLLCESNAIFNSVIDKLSRSNVDIILITGDLTKDGERISHEYVARYLMKLNIKGKKVYLINGNHDINNPRARIYIGNKAIPVSSINSNDFRKIYNNFGYKDAIAKDSNSLSYVVEPFKGLRIIAIDSCKYKNNSYLKKPNIKGELNSKTLVWIKRQLKLAKKQHIKIFAIMHHGIVNHFSVEGNLFSDCLLKNYKVIQKDFSHNGLNVIFTGHQHSQDIAKAFNKNLYDIETSSLDVYPNSYRLINITSNNELKITSKRIKNINYNLHGLSFKKYSKHFLVMLLKKSLPKRIQKYFIRLGYSKEYAHKKTAELISMKAYDNMSLLDVLVNATVTNCKGNERLNPKENLLINSLIKSNEPIKVRLGLLLFSLYTDSPPKDNSINIKIN
jgi:3',5'-cyclic AMP phosphodiesterase CpdA